MTAVMTIGAVARETGIAVRTIRFYEAEGVLPAPSRTASGYRTYSPNDVRRLHLIRSARTLGLGLAEVRALVEQAFASDCASFAPQMRALIAAKRVEADDRIAELRKFQRDLDALEEHVTHAECTAQPGQMVAECGYCPMIDDEGVTTMDKLKMDEALEVLVCEIGARPAGAPTFEQLAPQIRRVQRDAETITIVFENSVADDVAALVAAETACCADLSWTFERAPEVLVRIGASPAQLDTFEQMLTPST